MLLLFVNNMGPLLKYKFQNWKLRWEKPLNTSYLAIPSQKILPCKSLCFWKCWETTLCPLSSWHEPAVLRHQELNIQRRIACTVTGPVDVGNIMVYIYSIYWTKLPVGAGFFIGLGVLGSVVFCRGRLLGFFWSLLVFTLFPLREGVRNSNKRNMKIWSVKNASKCFFILND